MTSASDREIGLVCRAAFLLTAREFFVTADAVVDVRGYVPDMAGAEVHPREPVGAGALGPVRWLDRIGALLRDRVWPGQFS